MARYAINVGSSAGWILWKRTPYRGPRVPARIRTSPACRALILPILLRSPHYALPAASLQHTWTVSGNSEVSAVAATPDLSLVVAGTADGDVVGWRAGSGEEAFRLQLGGGRVSGLDVSADGQLVLVTLVSDDSEITAL